MRPALGAGSDSRRRRRSRSPWAAASEKMRAAPAAVRRRLESEGYPAQRADLCIQTRASRWSRTATASRLRRGGAAEAVINRDVAKYAASRTGAARRAASVRPQQPEQGDSEEPPNRCLQPLLPFWHPLPSPPGPSGPTAGPRGGCMRRATLRSLTPPAPARAATASRCPVPYLGVRCVGCDLSPD